MLLGVQNKNAQVSKGQKSPEVLAFFFSFPLNYFRTPHSRNLFAFSRCLYYSVCLFTPWARTKTVRYYYCFLSYGKWQSVMFKPTC